MSEKKYDIEVDQGGFRLICESLVRELGHCKSFNRGSDFEVERIARLEELIDFIEQFQGDA